MKRILFIANSLITSIISTSYTYRFFNMKPQRYLLRLKEQLSENTNIEITNSWLDCTLQTKNINGQTYHGYLGELTFTESNTTQSLQFFIIPAKKKVILKKI